MFSHRGTNELMWAIELCVMFDRYIKRLGIDMTNDKLVDAHWLKRHWIKTCMRLGDDVALRIVRSQKEKIIGKEEATDND
jgi:hypothetical protein